jgi:thioredoxin reductase (NADPH)
MKMYDVIVIGQGVAGINSAIYAASEGLSVLVIGSTFGGQIYSSAAIENLFSQPRITGRSLINIAYKQAMSFGAEFVKGTVEAIGYGYAGEGHKVFHVGYDNIVVLGKTVILALGVQYRTLEANGIENHIGKHIHTGDSVMTHAQRCKGKHIYIVGGANSAGQAAVYLSKYASKITMLVRSTLDKSMSAYLIKQIEAANNIEVMTKCSVESVNGNKIIETVIVDYDGDMIEICDCSSMFVFIGAEPSTKWIPDTIYTDNQGFIIVDNNKMTSMTGVFAVGDIESNSVKRVATAIGSSATAVNSIHKYLAEISA